jgi:hypothetical protein
MIKDLEEEIEQDEMNLAMKKAKLTQMMGSDDQDGNTSTVNPVTNEVDYEKMMKKKMMISKYKMES